MDYELPKRKNIRLQGFDYSESGAYYITFCTKNREKILWNDTIRFDEVNWKSNLSEIGQIVDRHINEYNGHKEIAVDDYVIMPDHVHILAFADGWNDDDDIMRNVQAAVTERPAAVPYTTGGTTGGTTGNTTGNTTGCRVNELQNKRIPHYVGTLKRFINREIGENIWQKSFYDVVIRNREDYIRIREYIDNNPRNIDDE